MLRFSGAKTTSVDCCYAVVIKEILLSNSHTCKPGSFYHKLCKLHNMFSMHLHQTQPFNSETQQHYNNNNYNYLRMTNVHNVML